MKNSSAFFNYHHKVWIANIIVHQFEDWFSMLMVNTTKLAQYGVVKQFKVIFILTICTTINLFLTDTVHDYCKN